MRKKHVLDSMSKSSIIELRDILYNLILPVIHEERALVFLCIGTDRSTGDSLGPLVGEKLKFLVRDKVALYGNLEHPIHAKNLVETIKNIEKTYKNPYIIAIDACLGKIHNVGKIYIEEKPLCPGAAMNKNLPEIGSLSITGIVNVSGSLEFMVLQNTRLYTVMTIADIISKGIYHSILKTMGGKKYSLSSEFETNPNEKKINIQI